MGSSIQKGKSNRQLEQNSYTQVYTFTSLNTTTPQRAAISPGTWNGANAYYIWGKKKKYKCEKYKKILLRSVTHCGDNREAHYSTEIVVGQEPAACCHTPHDARKESYTEENIILYKMTSKVCRRKIIQKEAQIKLK